MDDISSPWPSTNVAAPSSSSSSSSLKRVVPLEVDDNAAVTDQDMDTEDDDEEMQTDISSTSTTSSCTASFDSIDSDYTCPLFMDGLPSNFNQNPQLSALASLLEDEIREEYDNNEGEEEDDDDDCGNGGTYNKITVLPTIPEDRTATASSTVTSTTAIISSPKSKIWIKKPHGRHDLILQQRKWQRDQRQVILLQHQQGKTNIRQRGSGTSSSPKTLVVQKGPRSMLKISPHKKKATSKMMSVLSPSSAGRVSSSNDSHDERIVVNGSGCDIFGGRLAELSLSKTNIDTATATTMDSSGSSSSLDETDSRPGSSTTSKPSPSVGEATLFLNLWKL
jgi:hypothetical protein